MQLPNRTHQRSGQVSHRCRERAYYFGHEMDGHFVFPEGRNCRPESARYIVRTAGEAYELSPGREGSRHAPA